MAVNYYYLFKNISKVNLIIRGPATGLLCTGLAAGGSLLSLLSPKTRYIPPECFDPTSVT